MKKLGIKIEGLIHIGHPKRGETPLAGIPIVDIKTEFN